MIGVSTMSLVAVHLEVIIWVGGGPLEEYVGSLVAR